MVHVLPAGLSAVAAWLDTPKTDGTFAAIAARLQEISDAQTNTLRFVSEWATIPLPSWTTSAAETYINEPLQLNEPLTARYLATFLFAYAVMAILPLLPRGALRSLACFLAGAAAVSFVFTPPAHLHLAFTALLSYAILAAGQGVRAFRPWAHVVSGIAVFAYLCLRHITRSGVRASSIDDSVLQMVLTIKLYSLGCALYDGTAGAEDIQDSFAKAQKALAVNPSDRVASSTLNAARDKQARALTSLPDPLAFLGFVFNPSTVMAGPGFEYRVHAEAIERASPPSDVSRLLPAAWKLLWGVASLATAAHLQRVYPIGMVYDHAVLALTADPAAPTMLARLLVAYVSVLAVRLQYYSIWKLAEGAAVLGGFGYRPAGSSKAIPCLLLPELEWLLGAGLVRSFFTLLFGAASVDLRLAQFGCKLQGSPDVADWEGASNVSPLTIETRRSADHVVRYWNVHTQSWLERYIFRRVPRAGGLNKWATFFASALWHGFYAGYYLGFATVPIMQDSVRAVLTAFQGKGEGQGKKGGKDKGGSGSGRSGAAGPTLASILAGLVQWAVTQLSLLYVQLPFFLLDARRALTVWWSVGFAGHLIPLALFALAWAVSTCGGRGGGSVSAGGSDEGSTSGSGKGKAKAA